MQITFVISIFFFQQKNNSVKGRADDHAKGNSAKSFARPNSKNNIQQLEKAHIVSETAVNLHTVSSVKKQPKGLPSHCGPKIRHRYVFTNDVGKDFSPWLFYIRFFIQDFLRKKLGLVLSCN